MRYRLEGVAPGLDVIADDASSLEFAVGRTAVSVALPKDYAWSGDRLVAAEMEHRTPDDVARLLEQRADQLRASAGEEKLTPSEVSWLVEPPAAVVAHLDLVRGELRRASYRVVRLLRWVST
jgi:hypothetical protein